VRIVNTARGSIIDEAAVAAALKDGRVGGVAMDVFSVEPVRGDNPLLGLKNVIMTPHIAAGTRNEAWLERELGPLIDAVVAALRKA
jgi:phosphoglycerate dehydrogenase-like enzyme